MIPLDLISKIRGEIENLQAEIKSKWKAINDIQEKCVHVWTEPQYVPKRNIYGEASYCGVINYDEWERKCTICGKEQKTSKHLEIPDFGD